MTDFSKSGKFFKDPTPTITPHTAKSVSQYRKQVLEDEVDRGIFKEAGTSNTNYGNSDRFVSSAAGNVISNSRGFKKFANEGERSSANYRGHGGTVRQIPEIYSPLWLNSNLNLPRDRATVNAWSRSFFALNPIVQNAISLHSTYPISKLNIKCKNEKVEKFFAGMIEEIDLMNICCQIAQEYWILGEAFIYAELDERSAKWSRLLIQNPDYITVKHSVIAGEPIISLRPDENLRRIVTSNKPSDVQQRQRLDHSIVEHVKRGENIPLSNFYVSHLARRIAPYETRGTGLIVSCFRDLMLFDQLRECYSMDTEVLTNTGFKKISDLVYKSSNLELNPKYVSGAELDENGQVSSILTLKEDIKIACVNQATNEIEYHIPTELHMSQYNGKMLHFNGKKIDVLVTPNHKMWVKEQTNKQWEPYKKVEASKMLEKKKYWKFNSKAEYNLGNSIDSVEICGKSIPIKLFLKVLGYVVSEGWTYENFENGRYDASVGICQATSSDCYKDMKECFQNFADKLNKNCCSKEGIKFSKFKDSDMWEGRIHGKDLTQFFKKEIGVNNSTLSAEKHLPRWVLDLKPELLKIVLNSLMLGDGSDTFSKYGTDSHSFRYSTISKQLADDVYEIVFKLGFVPNICISTAMKAHGKTVTEYIVLWSNTNYGTEPLIYTGKKLDNNNGGGAVISEKDYNDVVWCFEVPTGLFITRRNGKISIQGNCKFAQASNMINPLTLVKIGSADYKPGPADLEKWRQVFEECHDEETEVLTDQGFKKFDEVIEYSEVMDGTYNSSYITNVYSKPGVKIACFNKESEMLEYHEPSAAHVYDYNGDMYHFHNDKMDIKVTPNHKMLVQKKKFYGTGKNRTSEWGSWDLVAAKDLKYSDRRFRSKIYWQGNDSIKEVKVGEQNVPIELYLEFLGYLISEGCLYTNNKSQHTVGICQTTTKKDGSINHSYLRMRECFDKFAKTIEKTYSEQFKEANGNNQASWSAILSGKYLYQHFSKEISGLEGNKSPNKIIPRWIFDLSPRLIKILLDALVEGDGSSRLTPVNKIENFSYYTSSKQLADDVFELVYKLGYVPTVFVKDDYNYLYNYGKISNPRNKLYTIFWSNTNNGKFPLLGKFSTDPRTKKKTEIVSKTNYSGKVWCFTVPTGMFITRRNGKITIQGNSQYDKDFKIFTHEAVTVERVGYNQGIVDISGDITQLIKEIYIGLMVPQVLMDGGADVTYANGGVSLDVLRQRYMQFRNMLTSWLRRKIFAPISKINDFYEYVDGEKILIVPDIDWNHMSLFDMGDYIQNLTQLTAEPKRVSVQTMYKSLGLDWEDEKRKMKMEAIHDAIALKEKDSLAKTALSELRSIGPDDEIQEILDTPVPGESPYDDSSGASGGIPSPPGGELPGLSSSPPPPSGLGGLGAPPPSGGGGTPPPAPGAPA